MNPTPTSAPPPPPLRSRAPPRSAPPADPPHPLPRQRGIKLTTVAPPPPEPPPRIDARAITSVAEPPSLRPLPKHASRAAPSRRTRPRRRRHRVRAAGGEGAGAADGGGEAADTFFLTAGAAESGDEDGDGDALGIDGLDAANIDVRTAVSALRYALQRLPTDAAFAADGGAHHHLATTASMAQRRRDKYVAPPRPPPMRTSLGAGAAFPPRQGGALAGMHDTLGELQQKLAAAEARVGVSAPPTENCMSSLVSMLSVMQEQQSVAARGGALPSQPSAA